MYNQSITKRNLEKCLAKIDFKGCHDFLEIEQRKKEVIDEALSLYATNRVIPDLTCTVFKKKKIYKMKSKGHVLLQRKMAHAIKVINSVKIINRDMTIKRIRQLLKDDSPFCVYRLDIKSFYESVDVGSLFLELSKGHVFTKKNLSVTKSLLLVNGNHQGLPRGYALSSMLSEVILKDFDNSLLTKENIIFYARFVDDILIITNAKEKTQDFIKQVESKLPFSLKLNIDKQKIIPFDKNQKGSFSYLGYLFQVEELKKNKERSLSLEIAPSKVNKIKTRVSLAFHEYNRELDIIVRKRYVPFIEDLLIRRATILLRDRIRFLSGNYTFIDHVLGSERAAGLYYNYHLIEGGKKKSLKELDAFITSALKRSNNKIFHRTRQYVSRFSTVRDGVKKITELSFYENFKKVTFFHFSEKRLEEIQKCWKYVA